jgi:glucose-1-phosphatase
MKEDHAIKAVIFDVGGVLLRTEDRAPREKMAEKLGLTYKELSAQIFDSEIADRSTIGEVDENEVWMYVQERFNLTAAELEQFRRDFWSGDDLDAGLIEFIRSLRQNYRIGLLSNAWTGTREALTKRFSFLDAFDVTIFSAEVGLKKPDPKIYHLVLRELEVEPREAVFVDDFEENITAARALGIHGVHFKGREQTITALKALLGLDERGQAGGD